MPSLPNSTPVAGGPLRRGALAVSIAAVALTGLAACSSSGSKTVSSSPAAATSSAAATSADPTTEAAATSAATSAAPATSKPASSASSMPATVSMIMIQSFKYAVPASVKPGAMVSVMNMDSEAHTVTADKDKAFDVKATPGKVVTFKAPTTPGSYPFHCTYHSNMHGVLVVK